MLHTFGHTLTIFCKMLDGTAGLPSVCNMKSRLQSSPLFSWVPTYAAHRRLERTRIFSPVAHSRILLFSREVHEEVESHFWISAHRASHLFQTRVFFRRDTILQSKSLSYVATEWWLIVSSCCLVTTNKAQYTSTSKQSNDLQPHSNRRPYWTQAAVSLRIRVEQSK